MSDLAYRMTELERRLANLLRLGRIFAADYPTARVRVKIGDLVTGWLPWFTRRASNDRDWWAPEINEQVMVLSPSGDPAQGVVLPAVYQNAHSAPGDTPDISRILFGNGTLVEHDRATGRLLISVRGNVEVVTDGDLNASVGGAATISAASQVRILSPVINIDAGNGQASQGSMTGSFSLVGDISVQGNISATGSITDGGGNTNHHSHP